MVWNRVNVPRQMPAPPRLPVRQKRTGLCCPLRESPVAKKFRMLPLSPCSPHPFEPHFRNRRSSRAGHFRSKTVRGPVQRFLIPDRFPSCLYEGGENLIDSVQSYTTTPFPVSDSLFTNLTKSKSYILWVSSLLSFIISHLSELSSTDVHILSHFYQILHIPQISRYPFLQIVDGVKNATGFLCKTAQMRSILISADPLSPVVFCNFITIFNNISPLYSLYCRICAILVLFTESSYKLYGTSPSDCRLN